MDPRSVIIILAAIMAPLFILYFWAPWDPPQAGVVVSLNASNIDILYLKKFRYGGTLFCSMCVPYRAEVKAFINNETICSGSNVELSISSNDSFRMGIKCPELANFVGQNVNIEAKGFVNNQFIGMDEKLVNITDDIK